MKRYTRHSLDRSRRSPIEALEGHISITGIADDGAETLLVKTESSMPSDSQQATITHAGASFELPPSF